MRFDPWFGPHARLGFCFEHDLVGKPASTFPDHALALRSGQVHLALGEDVAVQIGDPLPAAGGEVEIADREPDLRRDIGRVELRKPVFRRRAMRPGR